MVAQLKFYAYRKGHEHWPSSSADPMLSGPAIWHPNVRELLWVDQWQRVFLRNLGRNETSVTVFRISNDSIWSSSVSPAERPRMGCQPLGEHRLRQPCSVDQQCPGELTARPHPLGAYQREAIPHYTAIPKVGHADVSIPWTWNGLTILQNLQSLVAHDLVQISFRAVALHIPSRPLGSRRGMWSCLSKQLCPLCIAWNSYGFFPTKSSKSPCETKTPLKPIDRSRTFEGVIPPFRRQMQCQSPLLRTSAAARLESPQKTRCWALWFLVRRWATKAATKLSGTRPKRRESAAAVRNKSRLMPIIGISGIWFRAWGIDAKAKIAKFQGWQYRGIPVVDLSHRKRLGAGPTPACGFWSDAWPVLVKNMITPWNSSKPGDLRMFFL